MRVIQGLGGALLAAVSAVAIVVGALGLAGFVRSADDEVARARIVVVDGEDRTVAGDPAMVASFRADAAGTYTVWFTGMRSTNGGARTVLRSGWCSVRTDDRPTSDVRGSRTGSRARAGRRVTVGTFEAGPGAVEVRCSRSDVAGVPVGDDFVITEGDAADDPSLWFLVGGVFGAIFGGVLLARARG